MSVNSVRYLTDIARGQKNVPKTYVRDILADMSAKGARPPFLKKLLLMILNYLNF